MSVALRTAKLMVVTFWITGLCSFANVSATTVVGRLEDCPLCKRQFGTMAIRSWFQAGETSRDFGGSIAGAASQVITCPHCLFSAGSFDFKVTDGAESNSVRAALTTLRQRIRPVAANLLTNGLSAGDEYCVRLLQYRVAEVCDSQRRPDAARTAALHHSAYLWLKGGKYPQVVSEERLRAIKASQLAAQPSKPGLPKDLFWTYLTGELLRCAGETNKAVVWLEEAARLSALPGTKPESSYLGRWASEQAEKARRGDTNDGPRSLVDDPEQYRSLQRQLPKMVAALNSGKPSSQWLMNGPAKSKTVWQVAELAERGDTNAVAFLFGWLARLNDGDLSRRDFKVQLAVRIVAQQNWCISERTLAETKFQCAQILDAARYAARGGSIPKSVSHLLEKATANSVAAPAVISAASGRRDSALKPLLLSLMERSTDYRLTILVKEYFSLTGTASDIPALSLFTERFRHAHGASEWPGFTSNDIEDAIRLIRLREAFGE